MPWSPVMTWLRTPFLINAVDETELESSSTSPKNVLVSSKEAFNPVSLMFWMKVSMPSCEFRLMLDRVGAIVWEERFPLCKKLASMVLSIELPWLEDR